MSESNFKSNFSSSFIVISQSLIQNIFVGKILWTPGQLYIKEKWSSCYLDGRMWVLLCPDEKCLSTSAKAIAIMININIKFKVHKALVIA